MGKEPQYVLSVSYFGFLKIIDPSYQFSNHTPPPALLSK